MWIFKNRSGSEDYKRSVTKTKVTGQGVAEVTKNAREKCSSLSESNRKQKMGSPGLSSDCVAFSTPLKRSTQEVCMSQKIKNVQWFSARKRISNSYDLNSFYSLKNKKEIWMRKKISQTESKNVSRWTFTSIK